MKVECHCRDCYKNSDYEVPVDGRPWWNLCLRAAYVDQAPPIDKNGNCAWKDTRKWGGKRMKLVSPEEAGIDGH